MQLRLFLLPLIVVGTFLSGKASATTNLYDPSVSSSTVIDNSAVQLDGTLHDTNNNTNPWVIQVYSTAGQCLRVFVTSTNFDSRLTVVAPNGFVYSDDDNYDNVSRPLVKIANAPISGWYTVQVSHYSGAPINANFTLKYGRYTSGNPNCAGGTVPYTPPIGHGLSAATAKTGIGDVVPPRPGSPGSEDQ